MKIKQKLNIKRIPNHLVGVGILFVAKKGSAEGKEEYKEGKNAPEVLEGLVADPEADMYAADYAATQENWEKAGKFVEIIHSLIDNEKELYRFLQEEDAEIE